MVSTAALAVPNVTEPENYMDIDVEEEETMVTMVIMDDIVMGPTHCAFDNCTTAFLNACGHGESFCCVIKLNFGIAVMFGIVRITVLMALKPVKSTTMSGISIHSQEPNQV